MDVEADLSRLRDAAVQQQIRLWLALDKNAQSQQEAKRLIKEASEEQLKEVFCKHLKFGTAGLRAHMGAGFSRLNDVTIQQASQGLADYLIKRHGADICSTRGIIIGRDCRHNSERFSHLAAATFLSRGFRVYLCRSAVHTPLVAFGVLHLNCIAGIVITASHNPKEYNGYKVYDENGAQIIPPVDADIANAIQNNQSLWPEVEEVFDRSKGFIFVSEDKAQQLVDPTKELTEEYLSSITADLCMRKEETQKSSLKVVYTPMHGVGLPFAKALLSRFGFTQGLVTVDEQCIPDPDFSTVSFPNPEEEGALNLAIKKAEENNISFVVANDPDADRLGCAEKVNGEWHQFTGDEIGIMLAAYLLEVRVKQKKEKAKMLFISSVVSSSMLKAFAEANGCVYRCTGTGFKWIENRAALLQQQQSLEPVLLYEEALGFGVYAQVRDKDGVSAAAVLIELACKLHADGSNLYNFLLQQQQQHGFFLSCNVSVRQQQQQQQQIISHFRSNGSYIKCIGGYAIKTLIDAEKGVKIDNEEDRKNNKDDEAEKEENIQRNKPCIQFESLPLNELGCLFIFILFNKAVIKIRPSGTEDKIKIYAELCAHPSSSKMQTDKTQKEIQNIVQAIVRDIHKLTQTH